MHRILGTLVHTTSYEEAATKIVSWGAEGGARAIAAANVHMLIEAADDAHFRNQLNRFDIITPDGMPLVWLLRRRGYPNQSRVYGPNLMLHVCEKAAREGVPVGIFGGSPSALEGTVTKLRGRFPTLQINYAFSPPMRSGLIEEDDTTLQAIIDSGVGILFVALGCPKQEKWIAQQRAKLPIVLFAVGAAVDFISRQVSQAPLWMQERSLEWLYRLLVDPKRMLRRYIYTNSKFVYFTMVGRL
jgi:N-acetylglucosaminyldiphosphoundecaprenol N-acetyl-beta-D-mannosaminyltransferase